MAIGYTTDTWGDRTEYSCNFDAYETLNIDEMIEHQLANHDGFDVELDVTGNAGYVHQSLWCPDPGMSSNYPDGLISKKISELPQVSLTTGEWFWASTTIMRHDYQDTLNGITYDFMNMLTPTVAGAPLDNKYIVLDYNTSSKKFNLARQSQGGTGITNSASLHFGTGDTIRIIGCNDVGTGLYLWVGLNGATSVASTPDTSSAAQQVTNIIGANYDPIITVDDSLGFVQYDDYHTSGIHTHFAFGNFKPSAPQIVEWEQGDTMTLTSGQKMYYWNFGTQKQYGYLLEGV